jgi:transposase-like protein
MSDQYPVVTQNRGQGRALTADARARFIEYLARTANVTDAARHIGSHRNTLYDWRERDPAFRAAWDEAIEIATDELEQEARRRALHGTDEYLTCRNWLGA